MCSLRHPHDDTQEIERHKVRELLDTRAAARIHWGYWLAAIGFAAIAAAAWGFLLSQGLPDVNRMSRRDGALAGFFVVLGGAAIGSISVFVVARNQARLAAEQDRIDAYRESRLLTLLRHELATSDHAEGVREGGNDQARWDKYADLLESGRPGGEVTPIDKFLQSPQVRRQG